MDINIWNSWYVCISKAVADTWWKFHVNSTIRNIYSRKNVCWCVFIFPAVCYTHISTWATSFCVTSTFRASPLPFASCSGEVQASLRGWTWRAVLRLPLKPLCESGTHSNKQQSATPACTTELIHLFTEPVTTNLSVAVEVPPTASLDRRLYLHAA